MPETCTGNRTCLLCHHFDLSIGSYGYSEMTPGGPGRVDCMQGHYAIEPRSDTIDATSQLRLKMLKAVNCEDYRRYDA